MTNKYLKLADILSKEQWHSSFEYGAIKSQKSKKALLNTKDNRELFVSAGYKSSKVIVGSKKNAYNNGELLVHKSSRALWKISNDGKYIEPAFEDDIIISEEEE